MGAATMPGPCCCNALSPPPPPLRPPRARIRALRPHSSSSVYLLHRRSLAPIGSSSISSKHRWKFSCFQHDEYSSGIPETEFESVEDRELAELAKHNLDDWNDKRKDWFSSLQEVSNAIFNAKPWMVPWSASTILQVMLLWVASFWFVGSWIIPFIAHIVGFRKETLTYRGQALYSLLTDVAEGLAGIAILHCCLARFRPLPSDWFRFSLRGKWHFDVCLGCLMFPLVNRLSQFNLNLVPVLPSTPVSVSSVEQSIVARDPVAMALYAIVVSVCAPIWEEIVFRGFLLPSLTKYMPVWCSILVTSLAFALAHFNMQRMLPLIFLGVVMGTVFTRSRNLLASMLLHSLWNAFVFLDLMK
ncbi:hypothetical protein CDL15_Pgr023020 [Punica granatum]|uniref:CAAX prenyl protease 2/Lysostaphin resistance protein A-like domain-containing protein n=1 Tax=Punica granatum TaxID=22663 RepID=A0A218X495_PUNGR|nr:hypothetical protein CDL15_Pgr023020 [Punica granatum]